MVRLYRASTGEECERWPVDARDMLATGDWSLEPGKVLEQPAPAAAFGPQIVTKSEDAQPAQPVAIPKGRRGKGA